MDMYVIQLIFSRLSYQIKSTLLSNDRKFRVGAIKKTRHVIKKKTNHRVRIHIKL
jgi:hypothetical protein